MDGLQRRELIRIRTVSVRYNYLECCKIGVLTNLRREPPEYAVCYKAGLQATQASRTPLQAHDHVGAHAQQQTHLSSEEIH